MPEHSPGDSESRPPIQRAGSEAAGAPLMLPVVTLKHARHNTYEAELRKLLAVDLLILDDFALDTMDATFRNRAAYRCWPLRQHRTVDCVLHRLVAHSSVLRSFLTRPAVGPCGVFPTWKAA